MQESLKCLTEIFKNSAPLYIVGGYIRDRLLHKNPTDVDLCSSLTLPEVEKLLTNTNFKLKIKNASFGTAQIFNNEVKFEYSVFRKDFYSKNKNGKHSPNKVEFVKSLELDASRRDFTINAIYYNLCTGKICDVLGGITDIKNKVLKMTTPTTLQFDGERILRLARFYVELNFTIEQNTLLEATKNAQNVLSLSDTTINKFLEHIKNYSVTQKQKLKEFFKLINLEELKLVN